MGLLSLVLPIIGQPDATEDVKIPNDLSLIQSWANGGIDSTNLANEGIEDKKLKKNTITTDRLAVGTVLELLTTGTERKVAWGQGTISFSPGTFEATQTVGHGLGKTPTFLIAVCSTIAVQEAGEPRRCVVVSPNKDLGEADATNLYFTFEVVANYTITNNSTPFWWLAIG